ncbi:hypothetical protein TrVE_jg2625 [Triparma verrucosa]|uniref:Pseudouridine synthase RsuA/RluA-like domain-containing protein n=1 Tax=Triparma verrucosa TaxID=1606542 RepID=A0A9W7BGQ8_9STRA|nr:hypothetical protein TrVE_jg2625 [Triparma verrucosa]
MEAASENVGVAASMLNAVLATLKAGQEGDALDLLKCGEEKGIEPDIVSISLCTSLLLSSGDDGSAEDLLGVARKKVRRKRRRAEAAARRKGGGGGKSAFEKADCRILYEDSSFAIVYKPPGMACHGGKDKGKTLEDALRACWGTELSQITEAAGIVHRLDKGVSGCMAVAKTDVAAAKLISAFFKREIKKTYTSLNVGVPDAEEGVVEIPLGFMKLPARSTFKVVGVGEEASQLQVKTSTGRKHQVREHTALGLGTPIISDPLFDKGGDKIVPAAVKKLREEAPKNCFYLHCEELVVPVGVGLTDVDVLVTADVPDFWRLGVESIINKDRSF